MGIRIAILILASSLLTAWCAEAGSGRQNCLACHPVHYAEHGSCSSCHLGNPLTERKNIAHYGMIGGKYAWYRLGDVAMVRDGKHLLERLACRRCHQSGGHGNRLASSLDLAVQSKRPSELADAIRQPAAGMPDFRLDERRITAVVNAVLAGGGKAGKGAAEKPQVRHFENSLRTGQDVFSRNCGGCHRMLTAGQGLIGIGEAGPNLSGLLSSYYPAVSGNGRRWTWPLLKSWLNNPRRLKPDAVMRPLRLDGNQLRDLKSMLEVE